MRLSFSYAEWWIYCTVLLVLYLLQTQVACDSLGHDHSVRETKENVSKITQTSLFFLTIITRMKKAVLRQNRPIIFLLCLFAFFSACYLQILLASWPSPSHSSRLLFSAIAEISKECFSNNLLKRPFSDSTVAMQPNWERTHHLPVILC